VYAYYLPHLLDFPLKREGITDPLQLAQAKPPQAKRAQHLHVEKMIDFPQPAQAKPPPHLHEEEIMDPTLLAQAKPLLPLQEEKINHHQIAAVQPTHQCLAEYAGSEDLQTALWVKMS
jgi:hypothetical protein